MTITQELINSLLQKDDEDLIEMVIPAGELHTPETDKHRVRDMCMQCMEKYKDQVVKIYNSHIHSTQFAFDLCISLLPILTPSKMYSETAILVFILLIAKHGLSYIGLK